MSKRKDSKRDPRPSSDVSRRSILAAGTGLGAIMAAGVAPAFIREAGASTPRKVTFMLPWLFVGGHAFEFAAQKLYWPKRGLDVSITRGYGSGAATKTISAGQAMFGEASYGVVINGVSKGLDAVCIGAKLQKSPIGISCRADTGIRTVKDLQGPFAGAGAGIRRRRDVSRVCTGRRYRSGQGQDRERAPQQADQHGAQQAGRLHGHVLCQQRGLARLQDAGGSFPVCRLRSSDARSRVDHPERRDQEGPAVGAGHGRWRHGRSQATADRAGEVPRHHDRGQAGAENRGPRICC